MAVAHGDVGDDSGWLSRLEHAASVVVDVEALETGHSADVSGRLVVCRRDLQAPGGAQREGAARLGRETWHHRAAEGGIKFVRRVHS